MKKIKSEHYIQDLLANINEYITQMVEGTMLKKLDFKYLQLILSELSCFGLMLILIKGKHCNYTKVNNKYDEAD